VRGNGGIAATHLTSASDGGEWNHIITALQHTNEEYKKRSHGRACYNVNKINDIMDIR
jgi:hypothetical protein